MQTEPTVVFDPWIYVVEVRDDLQRPRGVWIAVTDSEHMVHRIRGELGETPWRIFDATCLPADAPDLTLDALADIARRVRAAPPELLAATVGIVGSIGHACELIAYNLLGVWPTDEDFAVWHSSHVTPPNGFNRRWREFLDAAGYVAELELKHGLKRLWLNGGRFAVFAL